MHHGMYQMSIDLKEQLSIGYLELSEDLPQRLPVSRVITVWLFYQYMLFCRLKCDTATMPLRNVHARIEFGYTSILQCAVLMPFISIRHVMMLILSCVHVFTAVPEHLRRGCGGRRVL